MAAKAKEHKKQHYIPRSYLSAWSDSDTPIGHEPYVWLFPRDERSGRKKAPDNILHETDMYTIHLANGERDLRIENALSILEGQFCGARDRIMEGGSLSDEDWANLIVFMAAMNARTVNYREQQRKTYQRVLDVGR